MMFDSNIIQKYLYAVTDEHFINHIKAVSKNIEQIIENCLNKRKREDFIVNKIVENINNKSINSKQFEVTTKAAFMHGKKYVNVISKFKYKVELCDAIFIFDLIYKNKKILEKVTFTQFKKLIHCINIKNFERQLEFLSDFPPFYIKLNEGIFYLPNINGCLGSFGFLDCDNKIMFLKAKDLNYMISNNFIKNKICCSDICYLINYLLPLIPTNCYAKNCHDFIKKYFSGYIGEYVYSSFLKYIYNYALVCFLKKLMNYLYNLGGNYRNVAEIFFKYNYADFPPDPPKKHIFNESNEFMGFGVILTTLNLTPTYE